MIEPFPSTPRSSPAVRLAAIGIALLGLLLAIRTTATSVDWIGRPFPGFLVLPNRVVASVGLGNWEGSTVDELYQSQVVAVDAVPLGDQASAYAEVRARPPGTPLRYRLRKDGSDREVAVRSQVFTTWDWVLLYGAYLVNSVVYLVCGVMVWLLRPRAALARAFLVFGIVWAGFFLTAMDLYGPGSFITLHFLCEALAPAAALQMVMLFPEPHRHARWRFAGYLVAAVIAAGYQRWLHDPPIFSRVLMVNMTSLGAVGVFLGFRLAAAYWYGSSELARQRVRIMALGTVLGFGVPGAVLLVSAIVWGQVSMNLASFTPFLFAVSVAYAIVKHDLFELEATVKRGAYYLLLTGAVGVTYSLAVFVLNRVLQGNAFTGSAAFPVLFTLAVLLVFNPLRNRLQALVDRLFFHTNYDGAQVLATLGARLGAVMSRERITAVVCDTIQAAIPNTGTRLIVAAAGASLDGAEIDALPPIVLEQLATGRVLTSFDPPESYDDPTIADTIRRALLAREVEIAVPVQYGTALSGVLVAGPKRSGLFYTGGDAGFLRAVAHQTAIALANAETYEALVTLNAELEARVRERTAQLERAYRELKEAEGHLVQSEKMASLGRLVAGVAHEINNPVSFIASSVPPLRRRLERLAGASGEQATRLVAESREMIDVIARGAERTTAIVRDLRSFSRLGEAQRKVVDVTEGLDVTLRLLESRWRDRITIVRDYQALPPIECDPGQMNQVFMNLVANACDALGPGGTIWIATAIRDGEVCITVRDDGPGIPPDVVGRVFDPFFTTKDVGAGTGLGLSIAHGIVTAHGGRLEVESRPGEGATFRVILPLPAAASAPRAAG